MTGAASLVRGAMFCFHCVWDGLWGLAAWRPASLLLSILLAKNVQRGSAAGASARPAR